MILTASAHHPGLEKNVSNGAAHDSAERGADAPKCHPDTRKAVQEDILSWIERGHQDTIPTTLMWLSGPAGSGKTAIAGSICDECLTRGWLAASFFFSAISGGPDRRAKGYLIPTIAYHLLRQKSIPGLRRAILAAIEDDPSVFMSRLDTQLDTLILEPLRQLDLTVNRSAWPKVIVIDGLDECGADTTKKRDVEHERRRFDDHQEILAVLRRASSDPACPFRIIISSRPEPAIRGCFASIPSHSFKQVFLDDKYDPEADIEVFARASLSKVGRDRGLQDDWFADDVPKILAQGASGQFVYVSTALRFVQDPIRPPYEQLQRILQWRSFNDSKPFATLDALYTGILETSPNPSLSAKWIRTIDYFQMNHDWYKKRLLEACPGETEYLLESLRSLVGLITSEGTFAFHFYHKSLLDFLGDPSRSASLHVSDEEVTRFHMDRHYLVLKSVF